VRDFLKEKRVSRGMGGGGRRKGGGELDELFYMNYCGCC